MSGGKVNEKSVAGPGFKGLELKVLEPNRA